MRDDFSSDLIKIGRKGFWLSAFLFSAFAWSSDLIQFQSQTYKTDFDTGITQAVGNVLIEFSGQTLNSDKADIDSKTNEVRAVGNVLFRQGRLSLSGEEFVLNMKTGFGLYKNVVLKMGDDLRIEATELEKIEANRFIGKNVKVTSCSDCPESWSVVGTFIDYKDDDFVEIHNALFQIRNIPVAYIPVFVFPTTAKRKSGFLFPQFANNQDLGFQFLLPYYWVHSEYSDSTLEYMFVSKAGHRAASEIRAIYSNLTALNGRFSILDNSGAEHGSNFLRQQQSRRYGYSLRQSWQLSENVTQRFVGELVSDPYYATDFSNDFSYVGFPSLTNEPSLSYQRDNFFSYIKFSFQQDNLPRLKPEASIHRSPEIGASWPSYQLFDPVRVSTSLNSVRFSRFNTSAVDSSSLWLREGERSTFNLRALAPVNFGGILDWAPSVDLRGDLYRFDDSEILDYSPQAYRIKTVVDQSLSTRYSRVFQIENSTLKAIRHSVEPSLRWSYSSPDLKSNHPFYSSPESPRFDLFDPDSPDLSPVSIGSLSEEQRASEHHLLTLGMGTRFVGRYGVEKRSYYEFFSAFLAQDINFWIREKSPDRLSNLRLSARGVYAGMVLSTEVTWDWKLLGISNFVNTFSYGWSLYSFSVSQSVQNFANSTKEESYGASFSIRRWGPYSVGFSGVYNPSEKDILNQAIGFSYESPGKCWSLQLHMSRPNSQKSWQNEWKPAIQFSLREATGGKSFL